MIDDYLHIMKKSGWQRTYIMHAPFSSERFNAGVVSAMQKKKILGVTSRYIIISEKNWSLCKSKKHAKIITHGCARDAAGVGVQAPTQGLQR